MLRALYVNNTRSLHIHEMHTGMQIYTMHVCKKRKGYMHVKDMWHAYAQQSMRQNTRHARTTHKQTYLEGKANRDDCTMTYSVGA
jgi:hydroxymethylglutaryl-CoA reductase